MPENTIRKEMPKAPTGLPSPMPIQEPQPKQTSTGASTAPSSPPSTTRRGNGRFSSLIGSASSLSSGSL